MPAPVVAFSTPVAAPRWQRHVLFSPLARIVWFALLMAACGALVLLAASLAGWSGKAAPPPYRALGRLALQVVPALLAYLIVVRGIERRRLRELAWRDLPAYGAGGLLLGFGVISIAVGVLWLAGSYHVIGTNAHVDWAGGLLVAGVGAGVGEEIVTRGVLFRMLEEGLGTWWALLASAAFFGAMHLGNPGASTWSSVAIMIEAGLLLALVYQVTRSLWASIGLHLAWNVAEGTLYGVAVSGNDARGWLRSTLTGPDWLTGGAFGMEASVVTVMVCLVPSTVLLAIALRRGSIVPPAWRRRGGAIKPLPAAAQTG